MDTSQLQAEQITLTGRRNKLNIPGDQMLAELADVASIYPLLVSLATTAQISAADQAFLDNLASPHTIVFLIVNQEFIHPKGVDLFPIEEILGELGQQDNAMFSHRYAPRSDQGGRSYIIQTAAVGTLEGKKLILGLLGPEQEIDNHRSAFRFARLVDQFRSADADVSAMLPQLQERLDFGLATFIVDRTSGRIISFNQRALERTRMAAANLLGTEISEVRELVFKPGTGDSLSMETLSHGDCHLCSVSLDHSTEGSPKSATPIDQILHRVRNKLTGITTAASYLQCLARDAQLTDGDEFTRVILDEAQGIDLCLTRFHLETRYSELAITSLNLVTELGHALEAACGHGKGEYRFDSGDDNGVIELSYPEESLRCLFESILSAHLDYRKSCHPTTTVRLSKSSDGKRAIVSIRTRATSGAGTCRAPRRQLRNDLTALTRHMGITIADSGGSDNNVRQTELVIQIPEQANSANTKS
ncbi:MAG: hypothetical protein ACE5FH_06040 [Candidatus Zixiibacteriota bacterium]